VKPPIKSIVIGETKNFAIVTLIDRDARNLFLKCDSLEYQGFRLLVTKPKGFFEKIFDSKNTIDPFNNIETGVEEQEH
jgi:hypothetical protein